MNILVLVLSVVVWGVVHSVLASVGAKDWLQRAVGKSGMRFYRLAYNAFSAISFIPILWLMAILPDHMLYQVPAPWMYLLLAGQVAAAILLAVGVLQTDTFSFIGLRQLFDDGEQPPHLVTRGLYRWVRHPLYSAGLLFIWLTPVMSENSLIVFIAATIYIFVGALFEERKLRREFGAAYMEYKAVTPMLIPGFIFGRNK